MATFNAQVRQVSDYVAALRAEGRPAKHFHAPVTPDGLLNGLPVRVGPGANPGIILRSDTFVELGNPNAGSSAFALWTDEPALLHDGRITLVGPDIAEAPGGSLPFGQVVLVGGKDLGVDEHQSIGLGQYVADQIEGYMVKSSSRNIWSRVSKAAGEKGFGFEALGRALMFLYKSSLAKVEAVEVLFVTSGKDDVRRLDEIGGQVREAGKEILKDYWKQRGYDLDCTLDCKSCGDREVCDDIRQVLAAKLRKERALPGGPAYAAEEGEG